jgi:YVTN family beta-propeller protein
MMKTNKKLHSLALAVALILFLILVSSAASAATEQSASPAGPYAYITNYYDGTVSVIDTATNDVTATVPVGKMPHGVAVNPDGKKVYVANRNSDTVSVIDTATNTVTNTVDVGNDPFGVAVSPDGKKVYVTNDESDAVSVIDTATNKVTDTVPVGNGPIGVAVNPAGTKVYVARYDNAVSVIDTTTNTVTAAVNVGTDPWGIAVNPAGTKVYVANMGNLSVDGNTVSVIDTATNTVTDTVSVGRRPVGVAVNPKGSKVYVTNSWDGTVSVIDTATNKVTDTVPVGGRKDPFGVAVNPDGKKVYVANSNSNIVSVIDTATNKVTDTVPVGNSPVAFGQFIGSLKTQPALPVANFSANPTYGKAPLNVSFTDSSTGTPTAWKWTFGDGTNSTVKNPTHKYSKAGNYTVSFKVSNAAGNNTTTKTNYIKVTTLLKPVANFTSNVTSGKVPLNVAFTDKSSGTPTSWKWTFGDGTNSTIKNPKHTYNKAGKYTVSLTVKNAAGSNVLTKSNYIIVTSAPKPPVAAFSVYPITGKAPLSVKFTDKSTGSPTSWSWNFGDKSTSTVKSPAHKYTKAGNYTVSLTVKNAAGSNTTIKTNYIKATAV